MAAKDYYDILGVARNASTGDIKKAYRQLAMKYHPDRNQGDSGAEDKFKEASEAYSVLGNEEKRKIYDQYGADGLRRTGGSGFSDFSFFSDSIFSDFGDILGDFFGFGSSQGRRGGPQKGRDIGMEVLLSLEDVYHGIEKELEVKKETNCDTCGGDGNEPGKSPESCNHCGGRGSVQRSSGFFAISTTCPVCKGTGKVIVHPCKTCDGKGRVEETKTIKVSIPAGIDAGNKLRVPGEGEAGYRGGRPGDLYLIIDVKEHPRFRREENHLIYDMEIGFSEAALGGSREIETFYGKEKVKIPAETQNGDYTKVKGKGFRNVNGWGKGHLIINFIVVTPTRLSPKEKELLKELGEIEKKKKRFDAKKGLFN